MRPSKLAALASLLLAVHLAGCKEASPPDAGTPAPSGPCNPTCLSTERCLRGSCVTPHCSQFNCPAGKVCLSDECVEAACVGVECGEGSTCAGGNCYANACGSGPCGDGKVCSGGACVTLACAGVTCGEGAVCVQGACEFEDCPGAPCAAGEVCRGDACTAISCLGVTCDTGRCVDGACTDCPVGQYPAGGGACVPQATLGVACTSNAACQSGHCVDGTCCDSACEGACQACDAKGTCAPVEDNAVDPACGASRCGAGGACDLGCGVDADCIPGATCVGGTCKADFAPGTACQTGLVCASGFCADGVCCNAACNGACDRCDLAGTLGTCTTAAKDSAGSPACGTYVCDGMGATCPTTCATNAACAAGAECLQGRCITRLPSGSGCAAPSECATGLCVDGVCCRTACPGTCEACDLPGQAGTCAPLADGQSDGACGAGLCGADGGCDSTCTSAADCYAGASCNGGACVASFPNGTACLSGLVCASGFCADGICCDKACGGACDACDQAGAVGRCAPLPLGTAGRCGTYTCNGGADCPLSCASNLECSAGNECVGGLCAPLKQNGVSCSEGNECSSGECVDGVCCATACAGPCKSCNVPGQAGACLAVPVNRDPEGECGATFCSGNAACLAACTGDVQCKAGSSCVGGACTGTPGSQAAGERCTSASQCNTGYCVDGVCCEGGCGGPCEACNLPGSAGRCTPVPRGTDPAGDCGAGECGGQRACMGGCSANSDCKPGSACVAGTCQLKPLGTGCGTGGECQSGACADGVCCDTACNGTCESCRPAGGAAGTCQVVPAGEDPAGECGTTFCSGGPSCLAGCLQQDPLLQLEGICKPGSQCVGNVCVPKANAYSCLKGTECASGHCVDGTCCDTECTDTCMACNLVGSVGTCAAYPLNSDPELECGGYRCSGNNGCTGSCAGSADCNPTAICQQGFCTDPGGTQLDGTACSSDRDCASGNCVDNVCCNAPCNGACESCAVPRSPGICTPVAKGTDLNGECGGTFCDGARACLGACSTASDCKAGSSCTGGTCSVPVTGRLNGSACTGDAQCASGACVDGACCDSDCAGPCRACNRPGMVGQCAPAVAGTDPAGDCGGGYCGEGGACDPSCASALDCKPASQCVGGQCTTVPPGGFPLATACAAASDCASGNCVDGVCCNIACTGTCRTCNLAGTVGTCTFYAVGQDPAGECRATFCNGAGACEASCAGDAQCKFGATCKGGKCVSGLKVDGTGCGGGAECASGHCTDGVCCNEACNAGPCDACSAALGAPQDGTCMMLGADKVCRPSSGGCDPAETCDGQSPSCPPDDRSSVGAVCANNSNGCLLDAFCDGSSSSCPPQYQAPDGTGCADPIIATFPPCTYDEPCGNVPHKRVVTRVDRFFKCVGGTCGIEDITLYKTCPNRNTDGTFCNDGSVCGARCGGGTCSQRIPLVCPPDAGCYCAG